MNTRTKLWTLLILVALLTFSVACSTADGASDDTKDGAALASDSEKSDKKGKDKEDKDGEDKKKEEQAVPVEVATLASGAIESVLKYSSTLEAEREVKVFAEAARLVRELKVEEGHRVRKGQVLIRLQDEEQRNALTKVENELAKAEREYKRQERLYSENLISEEVFNNATYELDQLRISREDSLRQLSYTEVRAPISGTITQRLVKLGDQITVGQHLFDIIDFNSLVARVYVPEKNLPQLSRGLQARLSARATGGRDYKGKIERIAPIVDARTGTVKVTIEVGGQPGLLPGMYVDVDLVTAERQDAVLIPKRALIYDNDQMYVFRLGEERRVERVFVEAKVTDKNFIEPIDGVAAGDQIVVAGQAGLKDGALVKLPGDEDKAENDEDAIVERASL